MRRHRAMHVAWIGKLKSDPLLSLASFFLLAKILSSLYSKYENLGSGRRSSKGAQNIIWP
jgi:hypothetical protein